MMKDNLLGGLELNSNDGSIATKDEQVAGGTKEEGKNNPDVILNELRSFSSEELSKINWISVARRKGDISHELGLMIFHPSLGAGHRDEFGKLQVWWPNKETFRPISLEWAEEMARVYGVRNFFRRSPRLALLERGPKLVEAGLITPDDFEQISGSSANEVFRIERDIKNGYAMIDGVRYYFGKGPEWEGARLVELAGDKLAVLKEEKVTGETKITHVFDKLEPGDSRLEPVFRAGTDKIINYRTRTRGESDKVFSLEDKTLNSFIESGPDNKRTERELLVYVAEKLFDFSKKLSLKGVNLSKLSVEEQAFLADLSIDADVEQKMIMFTNKYGLPGLRIFIALRGDPAVIIKLEDFIQLAGEGGARKLFEKYSDILDEVQKIDAEDKSMGSEVIEKDQREKISTNLEKRAGQMIARAFSDSKELSLEDLFNRLNKIKIEDEIFLATFRSLSQEDRARLIEVAEVITVDEVKSFELTSKDKEEMEIIYSENYRDKKYADLLVKLMESFNRSLEDQSTRWCVVRHHGAIKAFCRFSPMENGNLYFGAFNVDPAYKGSAIGETMLSSVIDREALGHVLEADCEAGSPISKKYLKNGFKKVEEYVYEGVPSWHIIRDDSKRALSEDSVKTQA